MGSEGQMGKGLSDITWGTDMQLIKITFPVES